MTAPTPSAPHAPHATPAFDIKDYRQPLVTSLGVILGFILGFLGQWVTEPNFALHTLADYLHFWGILASATLMLLALYRMLTPLSHPQSPYDYYRRTLQIYVVAVCLAFSMLVLGAFV